MFDQPIEIACPKCGKQASIRFLDLEANPHQNIICAGCGVTMRLNAEDLQVKMKEVREQVNKLTETIRKFGKDL